MAFLSDITSYNETYITIINLPWPLRMKGRKDEKTYFGGCIDLIYPIILICYLISKTIAPLALTFTFSL